MKIYKKLVFFILLLQSLSTPNLCAHSLLRAEIDQVCPSPVPEQYASIQPGNIVSAYFGNWDVYGQDAYHIEHIEPIASKLTHLIYGFMKPDPTTATCKPHDIWADVGGYEGYQSKVGGNFAKLVTLKKQFPHLKILLSVGGGTYNKKLLAIAQDQKKLLKFAQSCVDMLDFYDHEFLMDQQYKRVNHLAYESLFDGLDLDWEFSPSQVNVELAASYLLFVQELRRLLDIRDQKLGQRSLLTAALQVVPEIYTKLDLSAVAQHVDWFNVMAYDFFGPHSGQIGLNAPICGKLSKYSVDGALQRIMKLGVSPEKMVLGLPLYGYMYENTNGYNAYLSQKNKTKTITYRMIASKYIGNPLYKKTWHDQAVAPSLYSASERTFMSYDDHQSLAEKIKLAKEQRLQGVAVWRLSGDDAQHSVINSIAAMM